MKKRWKNDIFLVGALLLLTLVTFLVWRRAGTPGTWAVVRVNGEVVERHSLREEGTYALCDGGNVLVIREGGACMASADCPDKICVRQGRISRTGEVITCLPHRLTVTIEGGEVDVDMISGGGGG